MADPLLPSCPPCSLTDQEELWGWGCRRGCSSQPRGVTPSLLSHPTGGVRGVSSSFTEALVSVLCHCLFSLLKVRPAPFLPPFHFLHIPQCSGVSPCLRPSSPHSDVSLTLCSTPCYFPSFPSLSSGTATTDLILPCSPASVPHSVGMLSWDQGREIRTQGWIYFSRRGRALEGRQVFLQHPSNLSCKRQLLYVKKGCA